jgi:hypothetical protein
MRKQAFFYFGVAIVALVLTIYLALKSLFLMMNDYSFGTALPFVCGAILLVAVSGIYAFLGYCFALKFAVHVHNKEDGIEITDLRGRVIKQNKIRYTKKLSGMFNFERMKHQDFIFFRSDEKFWICEAESFLVSV